MEVKEVVSTIIHNLAFWQRREHRLQILEKDVSLWSNLGKIMIYLGKSSIVEKDQETHQKEHIFWIEIEHNIASYPMNSVKPKDVGLGITKIELNGVILTPEAHVTKVSISHHHDRMVELTRMIIKKREMRRILDTKEIDIIVEGDKIKPALHVQHTHTPILAALDEVLMVTCKQ